MREIVKVELTICHHKYTITLRITNQEIVEIGWKVFYLWPLQIGDLKLEAYIKSLKKKLAFQSPTILNDSLIWLIDWCSMLCSAYHTVKWRLMVVDVGVLVQLGQTRPLFVKVLAQEDTKGITRILV